MTAASSTASGSHDHFPDPVYKETVLRPLFEGAKAYFADGFRAIDRAHLVMLAEIGIVGGDDARAIAIALEAIDREVDVATLSYTGKVEDFFFFVEAELKARLGPDVAGRLHTGRSRNDIDHTLFRLRLKAEIDGLATRLLRLIGTLIDLAEREKGSIILAYTHGQPAQPSTFGHYLAAIIEGLLRDADRLAAAREVVDLSPMGAAAITTTGFPLNRSRVAELLGFSGPTLNSYGSIAAVDYITATYSAVELLFLHLGRPVQDLQFWSSFEVGQVRVPDAFVQISSIMPQKRNPVPIEHLRHLASQAMARARAILDIVHNTPFTDMNDSEGETQVAGYEAFASGARVLELLTALMPALTIDADRVAANIRRSCATITELADSLVRREGLSFRQAHAIAASVARNVVSQNGSLADDGYEPFQAAFSEVARRSTNVDRPAFAEIVSPEYFVSVRDRPGGPAPRALGEALSSYQARLKALRDTAAAHVRREAAAKQSLANAFGRLNKGNA
jgi:argininosuccinate lyase